MHAFHQLAWQIGVAKISPRILSTTSFIFDNVKVVPKAGAAEATFGMSSSSVVVLRETELVGHLVALLKRTKHNGFPVVDPGVVLGV